MDRRERDRYDRNAYGLDYDRYEGYRNDDTHYHHARNLTDDFEQHYQHERGHGDYHPRRSYHEGGQESDYGMNRSGRSYSTGSRYNDENDWNRNRDYSGRYSNEDMYRNDRDRNRERSSFGQPYGSYDRDRMYGRSNYENRTDRDFHFGSGDYDRTARHSHREDRSLERNWYSRDEDRRGLGRWANDY
ncbi:hypothetical protein [Pontibacter mangrovi]|uniref:Uncharacterized protein n=1 Tax=Pontibacter mangrovi TaxID=2589816 RepID=A0A501W3T7_9BACT|nr:hypothetical protein [Pontibacter mangrovi]TPE42960.1 hypothetical protein FJM65_15020 [Pontibacter mangrovi]